MRSSREHDGVEFIAEFKRVKHTVSGHAFWILDLNKYIPGNHDACRAFLACGRTRKDCFENADKVADAILEWGMPARKARAMLNEVGFVVSDKLWVEDKVPR